MTKLKKYVTSTYSNPAAVISWSDFKNSIDKLNLSSCAIDIVRFYESETLSEQQVHIFHIGNNNCSNVVEEPNHHNTNTMIRHFLLYLYQRNCIAALLKYILLKPLIHKLESSPLTQTHKGIFSHILKRLNELIFESVIVSFNGQNYDHFMIINHLVIILTTLNHKISIFKKGAAISTIHIKVKTNLPRNCNKLGHIKKKSKKKNDFLMSLYFKDIRNLVAPNLSLDKVGKMFNLSVSKLSFPYEQSTSIQRLKTLDSLFPYDESFWVDNFSSKHISLEERIHAQTLFTTKGFLNVYEYSTYYLIQDVMLLHDITLTLFHTYLRDSINIYIRRNFSISNLAFQQLFIVEPSKQINQNLAPKKINHPFCNYFVKQGVTGGLCTSFVHGVINTSSLINEHLNYVNPINLEPISWPNFQHLQPDTKPFSKTPAGISTIDIRSLYPSASVKKIPVNTPLLFNRFTQDDFKRLRRKGIPPILHVAGFCQNVLNKGNHSTDLFQLVNKPPRGVAEFQALEYFLKSLPNDIQVIRFQSHFTAFGQIYFSNYPIDGYLAFYWHDALYIKLIQYQSIYYHGHMSFCSIENDEHQQKKALETEHNKKQIIALYTHFVQQFQLTNVFFEYVEISDCNFKSHQIPNQSCFLFPYQKHYTYLSFLEKIYNQTLTGFLVVKDLEIKKSNQNPLFGFIIQKVEYDLKHLSPYTQGLIQKFISTPRVVSLHKSANFFVISTEYFLWLFKTFGFENTPDIYHALLFQKSNYLKSPIEAKLKLRKDLKNKIKTETNIEKKQIFEIQSEIIKLLLNSCYGFTLCSVNSGKFKCFRNARTLPSHKLRLAKIKTSIELAPKVFLNEYIIHRPDPFETTLGQVGASILFNSKIILLKRLYFLLKYLNPCKAQLLYMDTDSAHFLLSSPEFIDNVDTNLQNEFTALFPKHFEHSKISGIWVKEGFYTSAHYIGEKSYLLRDDTQNTFLTHMKGLSKYFQTKFMQENVNINVTPNISYNLFQKSSDFVIFKSSMTKNIFTNYLPLKRYFIHAGGSLPLKV